MTGGEIKNGQTLAGVVVGTAKLLLGSVGLFTLIYFGVRLGSGESQVQNTAAALIAHEQEALRSHEAIEAHTIERVKASQELLLTELRAINQRLDRIERRLP